MPKVDDSCQGPRKFREVVSNALERRFFYIPAFKIYGGVAGFYDYGPPGCAVKANILQCWRQHYVLEENMLEVECPCVTPKVVLKASGHVEKFTDLMVRDLETSSCYRADHLLKNAIAELLEKNATWAPEIVRKHEDVLARLDGYSAEELHALLLEYKIRAPQTKNELSKPYPFNLMFVTSIGPAGSMQGFLRPGTAQGIFVNFRDLLYYNGNKLPFAAAQIGQAFRNEIAPRQGLIRVRELTLAEIEHFVDPEDKSHPKFGNVKDLEFLIYLREAQLGAEKRAVLAKIGDAVSDGVVNNESLGYFIARTYLFLTKLGIDKSRLRFRQHLVSEMAHYAQDCWDAEIECSYGWIECVGLADRAAFDLEQHSQESRQPLVAFKRFNEPREVERVVVVPNSRILGRVLKKDGKIVKEALRAMTEDEAWAMQMRLDKDGEAPLLVCPTNQIFTITRDMVRIVKETREENGKNITPSLIEPSFGIGRIIYCLFEHSYYVRPDDGQRTVFRFSPLVAPIKATVLPLVSDARLDQEAHRISHSLTASGIANKIDTTATSIGKRYAQTDEIGIPFAVTVDFQTVDDGTVTLRERDSTKQVRIPVKEVASVVLRLVNDVRAWSDVAATYEGV
jgi:glycyl-tRNA synthetase